MAGPLDVIKQTSKTILFEEFNPTADDLFTLIKNENMSKAEFFKSVEERLEVKNFREFTEKFMPTVWEWTEFTNNPDMPVRYGYSLEKPNDKPYANELNLDQNEFYNMVMRLYEQKGCGGKANLDFDYTEIERLLSPQRVYERGKQLRKDLDYNYKKMLGLGESAKQEKNRCVKNINSIRAEIASQYNKSFSGTLKLILADTEQKLLALDKNDGGDVVSESKATKSLPCSIGLAADGSLDIRPIEIQDNDTEIKYLENTGSQKLLQLIESDYDANCKEKSEGVKNIIVSTYVGIQERCCLERSELEERRNTCTMLYKNMQETFANTLSAAIEKMLDVKVFFDHAAIDDKQNLPASLIVANCKIEKLLGNNDVKSYFADFLKESSQETYDKIWFAIIPAIGDEDFADDVEIEEDIDAPVIVNDHKENTKNITAPNGEELTSLSDLKVALEILSQAKITTFFNFKANETTGFGRLHNSVIQGYREKLESVEGNPYAVFVYPNFTVIPKKVTYINIGKTGYGGNESNVYIDIPGVYVESSYVAAGLVVASQNPDYLVQKFSSQKVRPDYPCVRFDFERGENKFKMLTKMNREGNVCWPSDVEKNISKDRFGFCFCGNEKFVDRQSVKNTYVFNSRNMCKESDGNYSPIYKRLTMDFITQYIRLTSPTSNGDKISVGDAQKFLKQDVSEWIRFSEDDRENNILRKDGDKTENIEIDGGKFKINFHGSISEMDIDITN